MKRVAFILWSLLLTAIVTIGVLVWMLQTTSGAKTTFYLLNSFAPVNVQYQDLKGSISSLTLTGVDINTEVASIKADDLSFDWNPITAFLKDDIQIDKFSAKNVLLVLTETETAAEPRSLGNIDWRLPFTVGVRSVTIENLHVPDFHQEPISLLTLSAQLNKDEWVINEMSLVHPELMGGLTAKLAPYEKLIHTVEINFQSPKTGQGIINFYGDTELSQLRVDLSEKGTQLNGSLENWLVNPKINFTADIDSPDLIGISSALKIKGNGTLNQGGISLDGIIDGQSIKIETLDYKHNDGEITVSSNGVFSDGPFKLIADFSEKELHQSEISWKPTLPVDNLQINSSISRIKGSWGKLSIVNDSKVRYQEQPARLNFVGQLNSFKELIIAPSTLSFLDGEFKFAGKLDLQTGLKAKLDGIATGIHLEKLDSKLPILRNGDFNINWEQTNSKSSLDANLANLQAMVSNKPITGNGKISMLDGQLKQANLILESGENDRISLDMLDPKKRVITIEADINNLGFFVANAGGKVSGKFKVDLKEVLLDGRLVAEKVAIPELLDLSDLKLTASHTGNDQIIDILSSDLKLKNYVVKQLNIRLDGSLQEHQLKSEFVDINERSLQMNGQGQWKNNEYQLKLQELISKSSELGTVRNLEPIDFTYSKSNFFIKPFCLDSDVAHFCGELQKSDSMVGNFDLTIAAIDDRKIINQQLGTVSFVPKTESKISAKFIIDNEQIRKLDFNASLAKLAIRNHENESLEIDNLVLLANDENGKITFSFNGDTAGGQLNLIGNVSNSLSDPEINALFKVGLPNLQDVSPLLISTDINEGELELEMQIVGKVKAPMLSGFARLKNTKVLIPELGTTQQITASLEMRDSQNGVINGAIISGAGKGELKGDIKWEKDPIVNISLTGSKLLIADSASLSLSASPELLLKYTPGTLDLTGLINIDNAFTSLATSGSNTSLSKDVIIVDDVLAPEALNAQQIRNIDITTEIINPARIDGYGIIGDVTGKLRITQKDSGPVLGNGQLKIAGQYKAFGQILQIESGRLNYVNTALDNPSLEFYATRTVGDVKVGVKVTGRPDALVSRLESTPVMRESDILNYLVLGKAPGAASESESGQLAKAAVALALARSESGINTVAGKAGLSELTLTQELGGLALSLGKQLSPRLYIGYTMGFIEPINVARVRYLLSSKWAIESEISEETRAVIKYRFEKD